MIEFGWVAGITKVLGGQSRIPVLPNRLVTQTSNKLGNFVRTPAVGNVELAGGAPFRTCLCPFARPELNNAASFSAMKILFTGPGVAARLGMAARTDQRDTQRY